MSSFAFARRPARTRPEQQQHVALLASTPSHSSILPSRATGQPARGLSSIVSIKTMTQSPLLTSSGTCTQQSNRNGQQQRTRDGRDSAHNDDRCVSHVHCPCGGTTPWYNKGGTKTWSLSSLALPRISLLCTTTYLLTSDAPTCPCRSTVHKIGHHLGLGHSHAQGNYKDTSAIMGVFCCEDNTPLLSFNGTKSWQVGWHAARHPWFDRKDRSWVGILIGEVNYKNKDVDLSARVVLKLNTARWITMGRLIRRP